MVERRGYLRLELVTLLALIVQTVVAAFWAGQLHQLVQEHDRRLTQIESYIDRQRDGGLR